MSKPPTPLITMTDSSIVSSPRRNLTPGIRVNPRRASTSQGRSQSGTTRSPSATSEMFIRPHKRSPRPPSETSYLSGPDTPKSPMEDDVFVANEKTALIRQDAARELDVGSSLSVSGEGSITDSVSSEPPDTDVKKKSRNLWFNIFKVFTMFTITVMCSVVLVSTVERHDVLHEAVAENERKVIDNQQGHTDYPILQMKVMGPFFPTIRNVTVDSEALQADVHIVVTSTHLQNQTVVNLQNQSVWILQVNESARQKGDLVQLTNQFRCHEEAGDNCTISVQVLDTTTDNRSLLVPLVYTVDRLTHHVENETIYAALILIFVYILIIFELVHRTLAAMLGALAALAVLAAINQRPSTEVIIGWMEMETLMLLFGMMIIVAIISDTGIFDYSALKAYKLAKGQVWPLVTLLCVFSAVVSAFLDNVTTILLMAPVTIRLCEVLNLDPRVILIAEVLFSNIGGTATAIGDPPNVIIVSGLESDGITFTLFTAHLFIGILLVGVVAYGFLRLYYRSMRQLSNVDPPEISELHHEIDMWRRAASRLVVVTREETLMKALFLQKAVELENHLNKMLHRKRRAARRDLNEQLRHLEREYQIKDWKLLAKCCGVLVVVLTMFFLYSFISDIHIGLGWIAVMGAMWLMVLADVNDLENILHRVEWSTLLFFSALFILMEALAELKLMSWIGDKISDVVTGIDGDQERLTMAVIIITWVSALASSFIDNIPYTTAMVPVLKQLSNNPELNVPLLPMVMSLAFGACLGGNGTLIGASANVVCAGIAEQHGYTISFKQFFKVGFPMMLVTVATATVYLLICHSAIKWNSV